MNSSHRLFTSIIVFIILFSSNSIIFSESTIDSDLYFSFTFSRPDITNINTENGSIIQIGSDDLPLTAYATQEKLPFKPVMIMLPAETETFDVDIILGSVNHISLAADQTVLKEGVIKSFSGTIYDSANGNDANYFPDTSYEILDVQYKQGVKLLPVILYPYQYDRSTHEICWYESIHISVDIISENEKVDQVILQSKLSQTQWPDIVENPLMVQSYQSIVHKQVQDDRVEYDYVLITSDNLLNSSSHAYDFYDLLDARIAQGLSTFVKTVEDITVEYTGVDVQERIRNFIKYMYEEHNTTYVLLGGDTPIVPIRMLDDVDGSDISEDEVSSDLYYQCLDGTYDYDNDRIYGERYDGISGNYPDFFAEVYVGRAPVNDLAQVSNFVEKTLTYEADDLLEDAYTKRVISAGEYLWNGEGGYGAGYLELCIDHDEEYDQITDGIPSNRYDIVKHYERDNDWTKLMMMAEIDIGAAIINHVGHGSPVNAMKLFVSDIDRLNNEGLYGLFYSQACHSGQVEIATCLAEKWVIAEQKGGFASIMNSGYGYGCTASYDGADNRFAREFFDALFSPSEEISRLGVAHMDAKEDNFYRINEENMIHNYYNKILLGDPCVEIKGAENTKAAFSYQPLYPITGETMYFSDESAGWLNLWQWDFDDGSTSYAQSPTHQFNHEGVFDVELMVRDTLGYQSTVTKEIMVKDKWPPVAKVSPQSHQGMNLTVAFSASESFDPDGQITLYQWSFGDDTTSTEENPVHTFPGFGSYQVRLAVTDDDDLMDTVFCTVVLEEQFPPDTPIIPTGGTTISLGNESTYSTSTSDPEYNQVQYQWKFGDDGLSEWTRFYESDETCAVNHVWNTGGDQYVKVKARDEYGMESEWSEKLSVQVIDMKDPEITLICPQNALYVGNMRLFSFSQPVLIGRTMLSVEVVDDGGVNKVVFYVDDAAVAEVNSAPFEWVWRPAVFIPKRVNVRIQAFDVAGNQASHSFEVIKIF